MSIYIHIPFCNHICSYCDFTKFYYNKKWVDSYLKALKKEIDKNYKNELVKTIYIGGGTPTSLDIDELEKLFKIISIFNKDKDIEYTIEANTDSLTLDKIKLFKKYGINRVSIGIESINKNIQKKLNRLENKDNIINVINNLKENGIDNINVDLMYAVPGENIKDLDNDLDFVLSLDVPHISTYSLIIEEHTRLFLEDTKYIDEYLDASMYKHICSKLKENGFIHYEVSNFSKCGYTSKHNLTYWNNSNYYGFGLGASGYIDNIRYKNTSNLDKYLKGDIITEKEVLNDNDKMIYEIILGLRTINGVSNSDFKAKYGKNIEDVFDIKEMLELGYLKWNSNNLVVLEDNFYVLNTILSTILS